MPRPEPEGQQRDAEEERENRFQRLVRVEPLDGGLAEDQAETGRDRRSEQEPAQEGDAVRARARAPNGDERRRQRERACGRGESVEQHVGTRGDHTSRRSRVGTRRVPLFGHQLRRGDRAARRVRGGSLFAGGLTRERDDNRADEREAEADHGDAGCASPGG